MLESRGWTITRVVEDVENWNTLVEMSSGAVALGSSLALSQKVKNIAWWWVLWRAYIAWSTGCGA